MRAFAQLLDRLSLTNSRNAKIRLVRDYLTTESDPDRGWAFAALTGVLTFDAAKPAMIRKAIEGRMDAQLFRWSYDYVGDLSEAVALAWWDTACRCERNPSRLCAEHRDELRAVEAANPGGLWTCDDCGASARLIRIEPIR